MSTDRRFKEATEILEHVVEIQRQVLAEDDSSQLASEHELARAYLKGKDEDRRDAEARTSRG